MCIYFHFHLCDYKSKYCSQSFSQSELECFPVEIMKVLTPCFFDPGGKQQASPAGGEHLHWEEGEGGLQ